MSRKLSENFAEYSDNEGESSQSSKPLSCHVEDHIEKLELEDKPNQIPKRKMSLIETLKKTCR